MQRVIHLIEALKGAGIPVPPFPYVEPVPVTPLGLPPPTARELQASLAAYELRVETWRQEVIALHQQHFPKP